MLSQIANVRIKNLLRGVLNANNERAKEETFANLRRETSISDAYAVYQFLESPLARGFAKVDAFPARPHRTSAFNFFGPAPIAHELTAQRVRIENNKEKILQAIKHLKALNTAFIRDEDAEIANQIRSISSQFGYSLFFLKKILSIKHLRTNNHDVNQAIQLYVSAFNTPRRNIIAVAIEDSIDPSGSYPKTRKSFIGFIAQGRFDKPTDAIITDHFHPALANESSASAVLQAYGIISIIDVAFFLLARNEDILSVITERDQPFLVQAVPAELRKAWTADFDNLDLSVFTRHDDDDPKFFEYNFFRHTSAWNEYRNVERYRRWVEVVVGNRLNGLATRSLSRTIAPALPQVSFTLTDLWKTECKAPLQIAAFDPLSGGCFHRTIALMSMIEAGETSEDMTGNELLALLDKTVDVAHWASAVELSSFLSERPKDWLFRYLKAALIHDALETSVSGHRLRKTIENVVIEQFGGNIVKFTDFLYSQGQHVGSHCYHTCTESFLVQLYRLFGSSNDVVEARAALLEWYSERTNAAHLADRAKSLRLDIKLRKVRDDIDDNRIYVDPLRFIQWLSDTIGPDLRSAIPLLSEWPQQVVSASDLANPVAPIQHPELRLGFLLNQAFTEFCSNKFYGVDSYIGRRIRHGTLRGTMVPEMRSLLDGFRAQNLLTEPQACAKFETWMINYEAIIKALGLELLQIRSDSKGKGAILSNIGGSAKYNTVKLAIESVAKLLTLENPVPNAIALIPEYCWLILEIDLKKIRAELQRVRDEEILIDPTHFLSDCEAQNTRAVTELCRNLNEAVSRKFSTLSLWLTRPTNISPSTTLALLFKAVIVEVKEQIPGYDPVVTELGISDLDLYGNRYHYVYDILYILVYNAARHGNPRGKLIFTTIAGESVGSNATFEVTVMSELKGGDLISEVEEKIQAAMTADIENAMVVEGFSGIRKIRTLAAQLDEISHFGVGSEGDSVKFRVDLTFPIT
ncbi:hypothetical protein DXT98_05995 [Agrobacterium sp. ICMP 7243]|nr:hypothetical protein DXT98_05995 [Agrobacterium sp. ICMP 7243]